MKKKELTSLRSKSSAELVKSVEKMRLEIVKAKANMLVSKEKNLKKVKNLRHDLAQTLSLINEKQITEKTRGDISADGREGGNVK